VFTSSCKKRVRKSSITYEHVDKTKNGSASKNQTKSDGKPGAEGAEKKEVSEKSVIARQKLAIGQPRRRAKEKEVL